MTEITKAKRVHTPKNFIFYITIKNTENPIHMEWRGLPQAVAKKMYSLTAKKMDMTPNNEVYTYGWEESK